MGSGKVTLQWSEFKNEKWAHLNYLNDSHIVVAEVCKVVDQSFSFIGQHRVRKIKLKSNVHWLIPSSYTLDITGVDNRPPLRRKGS